MRRSLNQSSVSKYGNPTKQSDTARRRDAIKAADGSSLHDRHRGDQGWDMIRTLAAGGADPSQLLELYYWTREPGIVDMIRAFLDLPEATQRSLGDFLLNARPRSVHSSFDAQGRLMLSQSVALPREQMEMPRPDVSH